MRAHRHTLAIAVLVAAAGSALGQTSWANPAGGLWNDAANWSPMNVPDTSAESAILGPLGAPYIVEFNLSATLLGLSLDPEATLSIRGPNSLLVGTDGITNNGTIFINTTGSTLNATLQASSNCSILGNGTIELNAQRSQLNDATIAGTGSATLTLGPGQTIHGSGVVAGPINLLGLVESDRDGRDLEAQDDIDMTGGGEMRGINNGTIALTGRIVGGTLSGSVEATGSSPTISGSTSINTNGVRASATLGLEAGGLTNNGTWIVNTIASASNAIIRANADTTIDGNGVIELNAQGSDLNDAALIGQPAFSLTIGPDQVVRGSGAVVGPIILNGSIVADRDARDIEVRGTIDASGGGVLRAENTARIALQGQLTGGTIAGGVEASLTLASVDGTTANGANGIRQTADLSIIGAGLTNNGTLTVNTIASNSNARLVCAQSTVLDGSGNIDLNAVSTDLNDAVVFTQPGQTLTVAALQSITGSGVVSGDYILDGTINANRPGRDIAVIGTFDLSGGGRIKGTNGGFVSMRGSIIGGTIQGGVEAEGVNASLSNVTATGQNAVRPTADLTILAGGLTNNGVLTINTIASNSNAALLIAENATINGNGSIDLNAVTSDLNDARILVAENMTLTIGANHSITGSGLVAGTITCNGMFNADRPDSDLAVTGAVDLSGGGVMQGTNGGFLSLSGSATGGHWLGGVQTSSRSAAASAVVMSGTNAVRNGADLNLDTNGITNNGTLLVNTIASSNDARINSAVDSTIAGSGTIELNAASSDHGDAQLRATDDAVLTVGPDQTITGRGRFTGSILLQGTIAPGTATDPTSDISIVGTTTLATGATTRVDIAGAGTADYDRFVGASGTLNSGGTLELTLLDNYTPNFGDRFVIADVGTVVGQFETVETPTIGLGTFRVVTNANQIEAVWTCEADVNGDGTTDFFDVLAFLNAFTSQALYGDYNEDGVNDFFDVLAFLNDFASGC